MFLYANILKARLDADINAVVTSITIDDASKLPTLGSGEYFLVRVSQDFKIEHMQCTAVAGNVLTVVRDTYYPYSFKADALCTISIDPYGYEITAGSVSGLDLHEVLSISSLRL